MDLKKAVEMALYALALAPSLHFALILLGSAPGYVLYPFILINIVLPIVLIAGRTSNAVFRTSEFQFVMNLFITNLIGTTVYAFVSLFVWPGAIVLDAWVSALPIYVLILTALVFVSWAIRGRQDP